MCSTKNFSKFITFFLAALYSIVTYGKEASFVPSSSTLSLDSSSNMFLGMGYSSIQDMRRGNALDKFDVIADGNLRGTRGDNGEGDVSDNLSKLGQSAEYSLVFAESMSELRRSLRLSVSASYGGSSFGASGSMSFFKSLNRSAYLSHLVIRYKITNSTRAIQQCKLTRDASRLLLSDKVGFYQKYGDEFVSSITTGGELLAVLTLESDSEQKKRELDIQLSGSYGAFSGSASFSESKFSSLKNKKVTLNYIKKGGASSALGSQDSVQGEGPEAFFKLYKEVFDLASTLAEEVEKAPVLVSAETLDYSVCGSVVPSALVSFPYTRLDFELLEGVYDRNPQLSCSGNVAWGIESKIMRALIDPVAYEAELSVEISNSNPPVILASQAQLAADQITTGGCN